jgi:alkylated DNA repair protein alkB family protein 8
MVTPNQVTVNEYIPGQGISPHVDTHTPFGEFIFSLSLGAGAASTAAHAPSPTPTLLPLPRFPFASVWARSEGM